MEEEDPPDLRSRLDSNNPERPHIKKKKLRLWTNEKGDQHQCLEEAEAGGSEPPPNKGPCCQLQPGSDFSCSERERFVLRICLQRHMRVHAGEKPFSCDVCGMRFTKKGSVKIHSLVHTKEKPFRCDICGERFSQKASAKLHTVVHTGKKAFGCFVCGKKFTRLESAMTHVRNIHSLKCAKRHIRIIEQ